MEKWQIFTVSYPSESGLRARLNLIWHRQRSWRPNSKFHPCRRKWAGLAKTRNQHTWAAQVNSIEPEAFRQARQYQPSNQRLLYHQEVRPHVTTIKTQL